MSEKTIFSPEQVDENEHLTVEEKFLDLLTLSPEETVEAKERLQAGIDRAQATAISPHDQESIALTAGIVKWRLLGTPDDPLPRGLVLQKTDIDGERRLIYDPAYSFDYGCYEAASARIDEGDSVKSVKSLIDKKVDHNLVAEYMLEIITGSNAYKLLDRFDSQLPRDEKPQPLGPFWRAIRETQVSQDVRERYGMLPDERISPKTEEDCRLRKELGRLDDETELVRAEESHETSPLEKAQHYFKSLIAAEAERSGELITAFITDEGGDWSVETDKKPEGYYVDDIDWVRRAAGRLAHSLNEVAPFVTAVTREWIEILMERVIWSDQGNTLTDAVRISKESVIHHLKDLSDEVRLPEARDYDGGHNEFCTTLLHPREEVTKDVKVKTVACQHGGFSYSQAQSWAEINTRRSERIGEVLHVSPYGKGADAHRMIQRVPRVAELPGAADSPELSLMFYREGLREGEDPYIPGFRLVDRRSDGRYDFVIDERGDPHTPAEVLIPEAGRQALADRYSEIGLDRLAGKVRRTRQLTVRELVADIQQSSVYAETEDMKKLGLPESLSVYSFQDLQQIVRKGDLYLQCTGAAKVAKLSLEEAFGPGCATVITGVMLARRSIDRDASHQQVVFSDGTQTYIVDATPASRHGNMPNDLLFPEKRRRWLRFGSMTAPGFDVQKSTLEPAIVEPIEQATSPNNNFRTRRALETQLKALLQVPDEEALYERAVALSVDDPLRRTIEVSIRAGEGDIEQQEIDKLRHYLELYERTDDNLRRQMRVASYDTSTIELLKATVERLEGEKTTQGQH